MLKENDLKQISIPQIYCEDILGLEMKNSAKIREMITHSALNTERKKGLQEFFGF